MLIAPTSCYSVIASLSINSNFSSSFSFSPSHCPHQKHKEFSQFFDHPLEMEKIIKYLEIDYSWEELGALQDDVYHSYRSNLLAHAVTKGLLTDTEYQNATFSIMVEYRIKGSTCASNPKTTSQPIVLCIGDDYTNIGDVFIRAFDEKNAYPPKAIRITFGGGSFPSTNEAFYSLILKEANTTATLRLLKARGGLD